MDIVIRDDESKRAYCIVGESLFYAHIFQDGSIDTKSWQPIDQELTPYHKDMIEIVNNLLSYKDNPDVIELRRIIAKHVIQKNEYPF